MHRRTVAATNSAKKQCKEMSIEESDLHSLFSDHDEESDLHSLFSDHDEESDLHSLVSSDYGKASDGTQLPSLPKSLRLVETSDEADEANEPDEGGEESDLHSLFSARINLYAFLNSQMLIKPTQPSQSDQESGEASEEYEASSREALAPDCRSDDREMVRHWMDPSFKNKTGSSAPALVGSPCNGSYEFRSKGVTHRCLHLEGTWNRSESLYTGCAVLSFFQLFYSPILCAIVNPRERRLVHSQYLLSIIRRRDKYKAISAQLLNHVISTFGLANICQAEDLYEKVHRNLILSAPILGLEDPQIHVCCPVCDKPCATLP
jgi:hypothetical protein